MNLASLQEDLPQVCYALLRKQHLLFGLYHIGSNSTIPRSWKVLDVWSPGHKRIYQAESGSGRDGRKHIGDLPAGDYRPRSGRRRFHESSTIPGIHEAYARPDSRNLCLASES
jgi:hypothetical protein